MKQRRPGKGTDEDVLSRRGSGQTADLGIFKARREEGAWVGRRRGKSRQATQVVGQEKARWEEGRTEDYFVGQSSA